MTSYTIESYQFYTRLWIFLVLFELILFLVNDCCIFLQPAKRRQMVNVVFYPSFTGTSYTPSVRRLTAQNVGALPPVTMTEARGTGAIVLKGFYYL